jgi:hypothetical protein
VTILATDSQLDAAAGAAAAALRSGRRPDLPPELDDHAELSELIDELVTLRRFVLALSCGALGQSLQLRGSVAGALKNLQATSRHLT